MLLILCFGLHMSGAFVTLSGLPLRPSPTNSPPLASSPSSFSTKRTTIGASEFTPRAARTVGVGVGVGGAGGRGGRAARGRGAVGPLMLEPLTLSAIVFMGAEKAMAKLRGKAAKDAGRRAEGEGGAVRSDARGEERERHREGGGEEGGGAEDVPLIRMGAAAAGGEGDVPKGDVPKGDVPKGDAPRPGRIGSGGEQMTRGAQLLSKRAKLKHTRAVKPMAKLLAEDPVAGTATLVQMGKHKLAQHMSHGDADDPLEEQLQAQFLKSALCTPSI